MSHTKTDHGNGTWTYRAREVVGVFASPDALEAAVDQLEIAGFDRAALSVLASDAKVKERIGRLYRSAAEATDDPRAPQAAFVGRDSRIEGEVVGIGLPFEIGGFAGAGGVVAAGGSLAAAIAGMIIGGAVGAGLGALLVLAVARRHVDAVRQQLARGGLILWVSTPDKESEHRALDVLRKNGATDVHVHTIDREWGLQDRPLGDAQLDPFLLEHDPKSKKAG